MRILVAMAMLLLLSAPGLAQDFGLEVRAGPAFHGLEADHSLFDPFKSGRLEDATIELIYTPTFDLSIIGSPRLAAGGTFNFRGYEQMVHVNLNWHVPVFSTPVYLEAGLGGALVSGYLHNPPPGYRQLGCNTMFYFQAGVGAELGDWTATLAAEHSSHAWLCSKDNEGLNSVALKIGHKF